MKYFSAKYFRFFDQLSNHNNKEWFEKHRDIYESEVKQPFRCFVEALMNKLINDLPELNRNPAKAIFRIYRDIRFSKDKTPYKTYMAAAFSRRGTKDMDYPGFYIQIGADEIMVGGGKYFCSKEDLVKIRQEIYYNTDTFNQLLADKEFKNKFGTLQGEQHKRLDAEYRELAITQPLIANKQFWYYASLSREQIIGEHPDRLVYAYLKAAYPMNSFLWEAVSNES